MMDTPDVNTPAVCLADICPPDVLTQRLHAQMPLTAAMGLVVDQVDETGVCVHAPLEANINHNQTAFGGSLSVLNIVCGWLLVHARLMATLAEPDGAKRVGLEAKEEAAPARLSAGEIDAAAGRFEIIIQDSHTRYIRPIAGKLVARASWPKADPWPNVCPVLARSGVARVQVRSEVLVSGKIAVSHDGVYVLTRQALK